MDRSGRIAAMVATLFVVGLATLAFSEERRPLELRTVSASPVDDEPTPEASPADRDISGPCDEAARERTPLHGCRRIRRRQLGPRLRR